jgi:hypothetical protein
MSTYKPYRRPQGKSYQSEQVKHMEALSKAHHPRQNPGMHRLDTMLEEKTESATERRMELTSGEE